MSAGSTPVWVSNSLRRYSWECYTVLRECKHHGLVEYALEKRGAYRCKQCRSQAVHKRRNRVREKLIAEFGGRCVRCGYGKCVGALHFHHVDPKVKSFGLSYKGMTRSYARVLEEAKKCILLCANCHAEVHAEIQAEIDASRVRER